MPSSEGESTLIRIYKTTWIRLNNLKTPGDNFDDVIQKLLSRVEASKRTVKEE